MTFWEKPTQVDTNETNTIQNLKPLKENSTEFKNINSQYINGKEIAKKTILEKLEKIKLDWQITKQEILFFSDLLEKWYISIDSKLTYKETLSPELYEALKKTVDIALNEILKIGYNINSIYEINELKEKWYNIPKEFIEKISKWWKWVLIIDNNNNLREENSMVSFFSWEDSIDYRQLDKNLMLNIKETLKKEWIEFKKIIIEENNDTYDISTIIAVVVWWTIKWVVSWWAAWIAIPLTLVPVPWLSATFAFVWPYTLAWWAIIWWILWWVNSYNDLKDWKINIDKGAMDVLKQIKVLWIDNK